MIMAFINWRIFLDHICDHADEAETQLVMHFKDFMNLGTCPEQKHQHEIQEQESEDQFLQGPIKATLVAEWRQGSCSFKAQL